MAALTVVAFALAELVGRRLRSPLAHPVLVAVLLVIAACKGLGVDGETYAKGGRYVSLLLGPSVVALGVTLHDRLPMLAERAKRVLLAIAVGGAVGVLTAAGVARLLGAPSAIVATLAPKSVTTPIAMGIAERTGGLPSLAAAIVITVGIVGAAIFPWLLRVMGIRDRTAWGLAMGAAAHGVGTARAIEEGPDEGAASAVALCLNGIVTAALAPIVVRILS